MAELQNLTLASFAEHLQTTFQASVEGSQAVELLMVSATDSGSGPGREQFSIVFRSPPNIFLPQQMYKMEHPQMGTFDLFLVPVRQEADGFYYEAAFARML
ncbi:MAG: hypothetical protein QOF02_3752 [Blastocatellia bacterium]|nr:hypothetical protein [Blastocatellia bacterium]